MKKKGFFALLRRKEYVIAGAFVVAAAVGTTVVYTNNQEKERQQIEMELAAEQQQELAAAEQAAEEQAAEASGIIPPKTTTGQAKNNSAAERIEEEQLTPEGGVLELEKPEEEASTEKIAEENTETEEQVKSQTAETVASRNELHFSPEEGIDWPLEGNVILNYSMDATVHFLTLDQYKYNPAVIIEGEVNDKVCSVARGKVESIESNEVTGCTMTVDLGDGYKAIYGQLKEPNFAEGDYVEAGHILGYVAEPTKYFSVEGSNLYFAMEKDGAPIDPLEFFE